LRCDSKDYTKLLTTPKAGKLLKGCINKAIIAMNLYDLGKTSALYFQMLNGYSGKAHQELKKETHTCIE
jgi:hypothetical protein